MIFRGTTLLHFELLQDIVKKSFCQKRNHLLGRTEQNTYAENFRKQGHLKFTFVCSTILSRRISLLGFWWQMLFGTETCAPPGFDVSINSCCCCSCTQIQIFSIQGVSQFVDILSPILSIFSRTPCSPNCGRVLLLKSALPKPSQTRDLSKKRWTNLWDLSK